MASKSHQKPRQNIAAIIFHGLAFGLFVCGLLYSIFSLGFLAPFGFLTAPASLALLFLISPAYNKIVSRQPLSGYARAAVWFVTLFTYIVGLLLLYGILQDATGTRCTGLFGSPSDCFSANLFVILFLFLNPFVYLLIIGVPLVLLWADRTK